jgi:hypothetical protein
MQVQQLKVVKEAGYADLVESLEAIDKVRDGILKGKMWRPADAETLSRASVRLAGLVSYMGEFVAEAEYKASQLKGAYKLKFEQIKLSYIAEKKTVAEAEARALEETSELLENHNQATYIHKLLQLKRSDTSDLIDAIRSRLSFIKQERGQLN